MADRLPEVLLCCAVLQLHDFHGAALLLKPQAEQMALSSPTAAAAEEYAGLTSGLKQHLPEAYPHLKP